LFLQYIYINRPLAQGTSVIRSLALKKSKENADKNLWENPHSGFTARHKKQGSRNMVNREECHFNRLSEESDPW